MKFRVARHTDDLTAMIKFYTEVLGLEILGGFKNHSNYDGVFIGKPDAEWHLEFTSSNEKIVHHFGEDDLLVFYPGSSSEFQQIILRFEKNQLIPVEAKNPYWQEKGITYADPDGYRIVINVPLATDQVHTQG